MKYCIKFPKKDCGKCENCIRNERNRIKSKERSKRIREFYNENKKSQIDSLDRLFKEFINK